MAERKSVFVSYSHNDAAWLAELKKWLKPLEAKGLVDVWDDTKIKPGALWRQEIQKALDAARLAVLLVTQDFLNSDFITKNELPPLLEAAGKDGLRILWIAVSPSTVADTPIGDYQALNNPAKPLSTLEAKDRDAQMLAMYQAIKGVLD